MNGKVGMFPNNFVELLPPEEEDKVNIPISFMHVEGSEGLKWELRFSPFSHGKM